MATDWAGTLLYPINDDLRVDSVYRIQVLVEGL